MPADRNYRGHEGREKYRTFGEPLADAYQVHLPNNRSIREFLDAIGGQCTAHERYSDGTLYFSGVVNQAAMRQYGIVQKPGWRPEIRRSRTLSLVVKNGTSDGTVPRLAVSDAVDLVMQSSLRAHIDSVELVRVVNTNGKSSHVFVQFEGEVMARSHVNSIDAMRYFHRSVGRWFFVHSPQLNSHYEYEPQAGIPFDPLVWRNPEYVGQRTLCFSLQDLHNPDTRPSDLHLVSDDALAQLVEQLFTTPLGDPSEDTAWERESSWSANRQSTLETMLPDPWDIVEAFPQGSSLEPSWAWDGDDLDLSGRKSLRGSAHRQIIGMQAVERIRRVDMERRGCVLLVQLKPVDAGGPDPQATLKRLQSEALSMTVPAAAPLGQRVPRIGVTSVSLNRSRQGDSELSDRTLFPCSPQQQHMQQHHQQQQQQQHMHQPAPVQKIGSLFAPLNDPLFSVFSADPAIGLGLGVSAEQAAMRQ